MKAVLRRYGWLIAAILLALGAAGLWTISVTHDVSLSASDLQARIDSQLPRSIALNGPIEAFVQSGSVKSAKVDLKDGRIALTVGLEGLLRGGKSFEIEAAAIGVPKFADGALYFEAETVDVRRLAYQGERPSELVGRLAEKLGAGKLGADKLADVIGSKAQKLDDWAATAADAAIRKLLMERPVYRVKDDMKGAVIKAALDDITVSDDRLNVRFSLWRLTTTAVGGLFSIVLGIIVAALVIRLILIGDFQ